jgi:hypothetical protein
VIDGLAERDQVVLLLARIALLHEACQRAQAELARNVDLERRRSDHRRVQVEALLQMMGDDAGGAADVEQGLRPPVLEVGREQLGADRRVLALLVLDRLGVDEAAVVRAHQRAIDVGIELGVGVGRHHRVEEDEAAAQAAVGPSRVAVAVAMGHADEALATAQVAGAAHLQRLLRVVIAERRDARLSGAIRGGGHPGLPAWSLAGRGRSEGV